MGGGRRKAKKAPWPLAAIGSAVVSFYRVKNAARTGRTHTLHRTQSYKSSQPIAPLMSSGLPMETHTENLVADGLTWSWCVPKQHYSFSPFPPNNEASHLQHLIPPPYPLQPNLPR
jgi:hypothetical protein